MKLRIALYGQLRDAGIGSTLVLESADKSLRAAEVLRLVAERLGAKRGLLDGAMLANQSEVLREDSVVTEGERLAVLPPVCGG